MKVTFTIALAFSCFSNYLAAQDYPCFSETFSGSTAGWTYSQGASIHDYNNPANNCINDRGITTPGVGGNNPCNLKTPELISNGGNKVKMKFDMFVMNANLKCETWKDFACTTSMDVVYYAGGTAYQAAIDYTLPPNGPGNSPTVNVNFYVGNTLPAGTPYQIELFFKFKSGVGNCVQQNTKYIFDNFSICDMPEVAERGSVQPVNPTVLVNRNEPAQLYPNPSRGASVINVPGTVTAKQVTVSDAYGRIVKRLAAVRVVDISGLAKGTYTVQVVAADGKIATHRLLIN